MPLTKIPPEEMLYPFGTANDGGDFIVVHRGLTSPGGVYGRFRSQWQAKREAVRLNAFHRELFQASSAASPAASHLEPHQPLGRTETRDRTLLWLGWLVAILLLAPLR